MEQVKVYNNLHLSRLLFDGTGIMFCNLVEVYLRAICVAHFQSNNILLFFEEV